MAIAKVQNPPGTPDYDPPASSKGRPGHRPSRQLSKEVGVSRPASRCSSSPPSPSRSYRSTSLTQCQSFSKKDQVAPRVLKNSEKLPSSKECQGSPSPQVSDSHSHRRVNFPAPLSRTVSKAVPSSRQSSRASARQSEPLMGRQSSKAVGLDRESGLEREWVEMMEKNWQALQAKKRTLARLAELQQESGQYAHPESNQSDQPEGMAESRTERFQDVPRKNVIKAEDDKAEGDDDDDEFLSYNGKRLHQRLSQRFLIDQERGRRRSRHLEACERLAAKNRYNKVQDMKKALSEQVECLEQDRLQAEQRKAATRRADSPMSSKASVCRGAPACRSARAVAPVAGSPRRPAPALALPKLGVHRATQEPATARQKNTPWQEVPPPPPDLEPGLPTSGVLARRPIMWSMGRTQEWISAVTGVTRGRSPPRPILPRLAGQEPLGSVLAERDRECSRRHRLQEMGVIAVEVRRFRDICA